MTISKEIYKRWKDQPILHDEDQWNGKYRTVGDMWTGEGYTIEKVMPNAELSIDISELDMTIDEVTEYIHKNYGDKWKFSRTEPRYESCVMAIFEEL